MKNMKTLAIAVVLGLAVCSSALAQGRPGRPGGQRPPDAAPSAAAHLTAAYASIAPFDANKDGQIDATEKAAIAKAMLDGKVQAPPHRSPPEGVQPDPEMLLNRLAMMYASLVPYDANKDGQLDAAEQAAVEQAIKDGKLRRPGGPGGGRPPGVGGPPR